MRYGLRAAILVAIAWSTASASAGAEPPGRAGARATPATACDPAAPRATITLGARTEVDRGRVHEIAGTGVAICVVRTGYPYRAGRGHRLWALVELSTDRRRETYELSTDRYARFEGVRIDVGIAKLSRASPRVWVLARRAP